MRSGGDELQRHAIVAVAQSRRLGAVVEDVPLMAAAPCAMVLVARHDELVVDPGLDRAFERGPEAGPAGAAVVFGARFEQWQLAPGAHENAFALLLVERA